MNTNMGSDGNQKSLHPCALDKSSLSIGRVNNFKWITKWLDKIVMSQLPFKRVLHTMPYFNKKVCAYG